MFKELNDLKSKKIIMKNDLMEIFNDLAKTISVHDLMLATAFAREDGKYVQASFREEYLEIYIKYLIIRIKDVKTDKKDYNEEIENKEYFSEAIQLLYNQFHDKTLYKNEKDKFPMIYTILCLYVTFILNEPVHPVGTPFPGSLKVTYEDGTYFCPVKDKQIETLQAACKFCIAKQSKL